MLALQPEQPDCASNQAMAILDRYPRITEQAKLLAAQVHPVINRKILSWAFIAIGIVLLGYVGGQYWGIYRGQQNLEAEWQRQASAVSMPGHADISAEQML